MNAAVINKPSRMSGAHIWERERHEHYVEPEWVSQRLFNVEQFPNPVWDPCCGFGRIPDAARSAGYITAATDIVDRNYLPGRAGQDFNFLMTQERIVGSIICNPPFDAFRKFAEHALSLGAEKVAMIWQVRRLNAARWLEETPLARIWLLTPRPSMPPGHVIARGEKPGSGTQDFAWLVWDGGNAGKPEIGWLHRDKVTP